jgi:hypothetical protein
MDGGALVVFTHAVAIFVVASVFDRTSPEFVQYDCDSVLSEGSTLFVDSETGAQHFSALTERECLVQDPIPASGSASLL